MIQQPSQRIAVVTSCSNQSPIITGDRERIIYLCTDNTDDLERDGVVELKHSVATTYSNKNFDERLMQSLRRNNIKSVVLLQNLGKHLSLDAMKIW